MTILPYVGGVGFVNLRRTCLRLKMICDTLEMSPRPVLWCRVPKIPPNKEMKSPEVITHKNQDTNKKTDPALLKLEAEITISFRLDSHIHRRFSI
ncbi:hypothetical protein ElyMa_002425400 [Elysia marginata]|uniref:Uncharacterized protein n=1 Tax=Elysia marginata TaxID=1093978 RepID=A0AAV4GGD6_9GAST|nr:hypothetical protein ElyMa_002425400 [Elysia marginata]